MEEKKRRKKLYRESIKTQHYDAYYQFRLKKEELAELKERAKKVDMKLAEYTRKKLMDEGGAVFNPKELIQHFFNYTGAVNKVGGNINQAANYMNYLKAQGYRGSDKEIKEFNELFHRFILITEELGTIMRKEFTKLK